MSAAHISLALPPATDTRPLLTPAQVAERLSISRSAVYTLLRSRALVGLRIGGLYRVRPADLAAFLAAAERGT